MTRHRSQKKNGGLHMTRGALARAMSMRLLAAASHRRTVTYGTLMRTFGLSRGRALSALIGVVDRLEYAKGAPGFAAIIVRKDTGFPGGGYFCDDGLPPTLRRPARRANDPRLSIEERNHIRAQQARIWAHYARISPRP